MTSIEASAIVASAAPPRQATARAGGIRDLRLDFFRGLALIFIFFNHVPGNVMSWVTNRSWGFSDATEIFVFVSGYTAAIAYGGVALRRGPVYAGVRVLHRVWQLYAAHIFLFVIFTAEIAYVAHRFENPAFVEEMAVMHFIRDPDTTLLQALLLKFRPANMDVLPLYIVLLAAFPFLLVPLRRWPMQLFAASLALYAVAYVFDVNLPGYPAGTRWYFNPFAWQLLFVMGALCASWRASLQQLRRIDWLLVPAAILYLIFAWAVVQTWNFASLESWMPDWLGRLLYPIDKTDMDPLRLIHFLAMAYIVSRLVGPDSGFLRGRLAEPVIRCGQNSLHVFCLGIFLSFTAHFVLVEMTGTGPLQQILISIAGVLLMTGMAYGIYWYKRAGAPAAGAGA